MRAAVLVASIAAGPPTLAALLAFFSSRSSARQGVQERSAVVAQSLENVHAAVGRVEATVDRVETGVIELRERVARLEGAQATQSVSGD
ncbi:MAG TPA: hypothetical protein VK988_00645 [Acidimicrobiales bacterium]|nr:hypothetical protein [Acidimicrobiales bacterium]